MTYTRLKIEIPNSTLTSSLIVEEVSNLLIIAGVDTFTVEDYSDLEETLSQGGIFYDYIDNDLLQSEEKDPVIFAYFNSDSEGEELYKSTLSLLDSLKSRDGYTTLTYSRDEVKNEDWENNWRQYFKPFHKKILPRHTCGAGFDVGFSCFGGCFGLYCKHVGSCCVGNRRYLCGCGSFV